MLMLVIIASLAVSTFAQTCDQAEADKFHQCLERSRPQHGGQGGPHQGGGHGGPNGGGQKFGRGNNGFAEMKQKHDECYTKNNCKVPEHQKPQDDDKNDKTKECLKTNFEAVKTCMNSKGAQFPKPQGGDNKKWGGEHGHMGGGQGHMGGGQGHMGGGHGGRKVDTKDCPAAAAVQTCLEALRPAGGNHTKPTTEERQQKFKQMCDAKQACFSAMPKGCQELLTKSKKDRCDCATKQKSGFQSCFSGSGDNKHGDRMHGGACEDRCQKGFQEHDD